MCAWLLGIARTLGQVQAIAQVQSGCCVITSLVPHPHSRHEALFTREGYVQKKTKSPSFLCSVVKPSAWECRPSASGSPPTPTSLSGRMLSADSAPDGVTLTTSTNAPPAKLPLCLKQFPPPDCHKHTPTRQRDYFKYPRQRDALQPKEKVAVTQRCGCRATGSPWGWATHHVRRLLDLGGQLERVVGR